MTRDYYVYIMANETRMLYVGVTNDLERRLYEHRTKRLDGFARRYAMDRLLYCEQAPDPQTAIAREKQLKGWVRHKKIALINETNPRWTDLAGDWFVEGPDSSLRSE